MSFRDPNSAAAVETPAAVRKRRREVSGILAVVMSVLMLPTSDALGHRDIDAVPASTT
jgi:hypothetical protein